MDTCRTDESPRSKVLFISTMVLIICTYVYFFTLLLIMILFCLAFKKYKDLSLKDNKNSRARNKYIDCLAVVPIVNSLDTFAFHRFKTTPEEKTELVTPKKSSLRNPSPRTSPKLKMKKKNKVGIMEFLTIPNLPVKKNKVANDDNTCTLCNQGFLMEDIVVNCDNGHTFHSQCFDDETKE